MLLRREHDVESVAVAVTSSTVQRNFTSTPQSRKSSSMRSEISPSIIVAKRSPRSTIVTLPPSARQMVANSIPTAPPPTMTIAFGAPRSRYRIVSVSKTPGSSKAAALRPPRTRPGRNQNDLRTQRRKRAALARNANGAVAIETRLPFDVVDVAGEEVLFRKILKQRADAPRSRANDAHREFGRNRHAQAVDVAVAESGDEERRFAQRLGRRAARRRDRASRAILFHDGTPQAKERRQLGGTLARRPRTNCDQIVHSRHGLTIDALLHLIEHLPEGSS